MIVVRGLQVVSRAAVRASAVRRIEPSVTGCAGIAKVRMESKAGQARLVREHGVIETDILFPHVQQHTDCPAPSINKIQQAPEVVHRQATGPVGQGLHILNPCISVIGLGRVGGIAGPGHLRKLFCRHYDLALRNWRRDRVSQRFGGQFSSRAWRVPGAVH